MKIKQHTLQSFEFTITKSEDQEAINKSEEQFFKFFEKNEPLLTGHILIFDFITEKIESFLSEKKICFIDKQKYCNLSIRKRDSVVELEVETEKEEQKIITNSNSSKYKFQERAIIKTPIRSGEYIETDNDMIILSRINNGAEIISNGNMEIFGEIHGKVECYGDYIIVSHIGKLGSVIFNGVILDNNKFKKRKQLISLSKDNTLIYQEL